jgi:hypothetical protein
LQDACQSEAVGELQLLQRAALFALSKTVDRPTPPVDGPSPVATTRDRDTLPAPQFRRREHRADDPDREGGELSYDLHLIRRVDGVDPAASARELLGQDEDDLDPGEPSPALEDRKRRLAALLIAGNPQLEPFPFDYPALATLNEITEDEARLRFRHVELNGPEDGNGIQITLHDDRADITVPYWHQAPEATRVFEEIWGYLSILEREGPYAIYDPQLDRLIDLASDRDAVQRQYAGVVAQMPGITAQSKPQKPWWRLW